MIARLSGILLEKTPQSAIIDVQGVGYEVSTSLETYHQLPELNETVSLLIHTYVREDELLLFAFHGLREKQLFQHLIRVNGVGPRLALNILSGISSDELMMALRTGDVVRMTTIPGVGKKTAERLILDLKDKLIKLHGADDTSSLTDVSTAKPLEEDLVSVLLNLGYKRNLAEKAVRELKFDDEVSLQEAVRLTLKHLANGHHRKAG